MRKFALVAAVTVAAVPVGVAAAQVAKTQTLSVKTPSAAGSKAKPKATSIFVKTGVTGDNPADTGTFAASSVTISFDKNLKFNNAKFPTCTRTKVVAGSCPTGSQVGSGKASAVAGSNGIKPNFVITAYNGPKNTLILNLKGQDAFNSLEKVLVGTLKSGSGKYGKKLVVPIPLDVQSPVPGLKATLTNFETKVQKRFKGVNYVESIGCTSKKYQFRGDYKYDDGTKKTLTTTAACKK